VPSYADWGGYLRNTPGYLRNLGVGTYWIRNVLGDCAHLKRTRKYKVVCPNWMIGMGERSDNPPIEELQEVADCWSLDAVHPASETYKLMVGLLD
jgi:hypothetical protein